MSRTALFVAGARFFSGAERALLLLVKSLDPSRYRPFVLVGCDGEMTAQLDAAGIPNACVELQHTDWRHPIAFLRCVLAIAGHMRSTGAAIAHANEVPSFQALGYAARLARVPALTHVRFPETAEGFDWSLKPGFRRAIFVSDALRQEAMAVRPGLFEERGETIHDGVVPRDPPSEVERAAGRQALGLPADGVLVLLSGQVVEVKGIWEFLEAARLLVGAGVDVTFAVLGDDLRGKGETRRLAEERAGALGLADRVRFLGFRRDAARLVPLFDVVAVPSHVEPLGNSTLEAMAAAVPVVGSRVGGIPEMIVDGETGILIPPRDAAALAGALQRLIASAPLRARLGAAARQRAMLVFGLDEHARRVQDLYDAVLDGPTASAGEARDRSVRPRTTATVGSAAASDTADLARLEAG